jgi:hypothetical protein
MLKSKLTIESKTAVCRCSAITSLFACSVLADCYGIVEKDFDRNESPCVNGAGDDVKETYL